VGVVASRVRFLPLLPVLFRLSPLPFPQCAPSSLDQPLTSPYLDLATRRISIYWLILLVPVYSTISSLANGQPYRSRELGVMVFIAVVGYVSNRAATTFVRFSPLFSLEEENVLTRRRRRLQIFERSDIVSFIGATVIGLLGNLYSRVVNGTSFTGSSSSLLLYFRY
jgi:hypothetical protein